MKSAPSTTPQDAADPETWTSLAATLVDRIRHFLIILSPDGIIFEASRAALDYLGSSRSEAVGRPIWELVSQADEGAALKAAVQRAASGSRVRHQLERTNAEAQATAELVLTSVPSDGEAAGLVLVESTGPLSHHLESERKPAGSGDKYARIVNISADAIICTDESSRITDFNWGAERIFGYSADEVIGRPLDMLIPAHHREMHGSHMRAFAVAPDAARRMGERREIAGLRRNGEEFPADASISKQDIDGRRVYTVVLRDITAQKRAEAAQRFLARAGSLLASSLDVATTFDSVARLATDFIADCCVIFEVTDSGTIRRVALAAADPAVDQALRDYRGRSMPLQSSHPACRVIESGQPMLISDTTTEPGIAGVGADELELFRRFGVSTAMIVPLVARGRTSGAIALYGWSEGRTFNVDDLSLAQELALGSALAVDNARLYEAARNAILARDDVLAVVSHDLGNPLSAIRIAVSVLLRAGAAGSGVDAGREHLLGIRKSTEQMERLIRDLLDVKRIEAGQLALGAHPVLPAALIEEAIELFRTIAAGKSITLRSDTSPVRTPVLADHERIIQVFSNLVGNAVKFAPPGGTVELLAEAAGDEVVFSVRDDGPGIDEADLDQIFDPFWRARRKRGGGGGLGLGLAIVKGIVQAHGGRVWAESRPGSGTTVSFTLPSADTSPGE